MKYYNRGAAVEYARKWALSRNPVYYDYELLGGDCTNFCSQCVYAGARVMDYRQTFGWYYKSANDKSPSWTGVEFLYNYLTRKNPTPGPWGYETTIENIRPGDIVQMSFGLGRFSHSPFIIAVLPEVVTLDSILVAAHSEDSLDRPLSTYSFTDIRFIRISDDVRE